MNRTWTILLCALCLTGCRSFQATPKPQQGGRLLATIPPVTRPPNVTGVEWTNAPVEINMVAPENPSQQTRTTYTRHSTLAGVEESLISELAPVQADSARAAWGGIEKFKAQLATYRPIRLAGLALIVLACAGFIPQVRLIMGRSGQTAAFVSGFGLVFGAQMFQGNETLAMILTVLALGVWVVARKYGILQGAVLQTKGKI